MISGSDTKLSNVPLKFTLGGDAIKRQAQPTTEFLTEYMHMMKPALLLLALSTSGCATMSDVYSEGKVVDVEGREYVVRRAIPQKTITWRCRTYQLSHPSP